MNRVINYINHAASYIFIIGVILGGLLPSVSGFVRPSMNYLMMIMLFLAFMKIDFSRLKHEIINWRYQIYLLVLAVVIVPIIIYFIGYALSVFTFLPRDNTVAILLVFAAPTAVATPTLCMLLNANIERALANVVFATLLVPITLPLLVFLVLGKSVHFNLPKLGIFIATIILVPFIIAILVRWLLPLIRTKTIEYISPLSVVVIFLVIFASASNLHLLLHNSWFVAARSLVVFSLLFGIAFLIGWLLALRKDRVDKLTAASIACWGNLGLIILIAHSFFGTDYPKVMLFVLMAALAWNLTFAITKMVVQHNLLCYLDKMFNNKNKLHNHHHHR
ncbi:MAG: bile acid:sodium symporter [Gammaproteobacteria bacterium]|nr:bile acid:sodium symporter [Gammaproteobacteria bacterium]